LIDRDGTVIPVTDLSRFAKLPTVVGDDQARRGAAQLLDLLANEPDLASRVTAAVLVGDRRWNLRIDNTIDVLLPEDDIAGAWAKLAQLERSNRVLQRDVQTVDMRLPDRLVMRVTDTGTKDAPAAKKPHSLGKST
jgi:cell division protein FtsQ